MRSSWFILSDLKNARRMGPFLVIVKHQLRRVRRDRRGVNLGADFVRCQRYAEKVRGPISRLEAAGNNFPALMFSPCAL
jgi:hypothetical protein